VTRQRGHVVIPWGCVCSSRFDYLRGDSALDGVVDEFVVNHGRDTYTSCAMIGWYSYILVEGLGGGLAQQEANSRVGLIF
jgi:hypothetical protein